MSLEKIERNGLEKLGKRIAGSEQQAKRLVQQALAVLGFRVVHESWGMYMETADGKCDVFFEDMPAFSASWSSILGKLVACKEICMETKEEWMSKDWPSNREKDTDARWTSNPLFGCKSKEELELKLDLYNLVWEQQEGRKLEE